MEEKIEMPTTNLTPPSLEIKMKNYRVYRLVYFTLGFIEVFLALRFVFKLFGANPQNIFALLVYGLSDVLLLPFNGLFPGATLVADQTVRRFEVSTLTAMIVYALLGWGIAKLILIFKSKPLSDSK